MPVLRCAESGGRGCAADADADAGAAVNTPRRRAPQDKDLFYTDFAAAFQTLEELGTAGLKAPLQLA